MAHGRSAPRQIIANTNIAARCKPTYFAYFQRANIVIIGLIVGATISVILLPICSVMLFVYLALVESEYTGYD